MVTTSYFDGPGAVPAEDEVGMAVYDFEVLKDGAVIAAEQTIALPDTSAAWPKIAELRRRLMNRATKSASGTRPAELSS